MTKEIIIEDIQNSCEEIEWKTDPDVEVYTLETLPKNLSDILTNSYVLENRDEYRSARLSNTQGTTKSGSAMNSLFSMMPETTETDTKVKAQLKVQKVILAFDDYEEQGYKAQDIVDSGLFSYIIPRSQKALDIQKRRVKEKAEVFTPTHLCNKQNNMIDDHALYPGAFSSPVPPEYLLQETQAVEAALKDSSFGVNSYIPSEKVDFKKTDLTPEQYIARRVLEITCGEGPYLFSRYDTVTGAHIPVRDEISRRFWRVGHLDRKLRVVSENFADKQSWVQQAIIAYQNTYGYEWQGDNLMLARLNAFNTFLEYYYDQFKDVDVADSVLELIATIISQNLFQMDGIKHVVPLSEKTEKKKTAVKNLEQKYTGYDGVLPVITWHDGVWFPYEDIVRDGIKKRMKK